MILIFQIYSELPPYREGSQECNLTPQEKGKYKGCVNWNMFYTNCRLEFHRGLIATTKAYRKLKLYRFYSTKTKENLGNLFVMVVLLF